MLRYNYFCKNYLSLKVVLFDNWVCFTKEIRSMWNSIITQRHRWVLLFSSIYQDKSLREFIAQFRKKLGINLGTDFEKVSNLVRKMWEAMIMSNKILKYWTLLFLIFLSVSWWLLSKLFACTSIIMLQVN